LPGKLTVGLTGGIASGKSLAASSFERLGIETVDADDVARDIVEPGEPALAEIAEHFGPDVIGDDGRMIRPRMRQIVFDDASAREKLEAITHPIIRQAIDALVKRSKQRVIVIEAIKLLDGDLKDWVDTGRYPHVS